MAVVIPLRRILLPYARLERRLFTMFVLEMSKSDSMRERFPECLEPRIITGRFYIFLWDLDSFRN